MRLLSTLLLLAACGPSPPDDADDVGTGDPTGDPGTGDPAPPTTGDAPSPTTLPPPDDTGGPPPPEETTEGPEPLLQVLALTMLDPGSSALNGVAQWQPPPGTFCNQGPQPVCEQPPELGVGRLLIDGVLAPPDETSAPLGARVAALFPFKSCTLGCGRYEYVLMGPSGAGTGNGLILPGLACATADENVWLALDLGVLTEDGDHNGVLRVADACGLESNEKSFDITPL